MSDITSDDHDAFGYAHGTDVTINGANHVVFFDYEGDDIFVWWLPGDTCTNGEHLAEVERQIVYEHLSVWWRDWTAPFPDDDRCDW